MPRAQLTTDEIESFRARACEAATRLFAEHGVAAVSIRQIATALGVSPMTPYRYFENKDELLAMVRTLGFRRFADRQEHAAARADNDQALAALAAAYIAFAVDEPEAYKVMFQLEQAPSDRYPDLEAEHRRAFSFLLAATRATYSHQSDDEALTTAHLLWAQIHGLVSLHLAGKLIMGRAFDELCASPRISATDWSGS